MATLLYRDPTTGEFKPLAGAVSNDFVAQADPPTDPTVDLWLDTDDNTTGQIVQTLSGVYSSTHLADYKYNGNVTGYVVITIPNVPFAMLNLKLTGYNYAQGAFEIMIGGYTYQAGPFWYNNSTDAWGRFPGSAQYLDVRYMYSGDSSNAVFALAIGSASTAWAYPQLVLGGISGHVGAAVVGTAGWGLDVTTDISAWTVYATKQAYLGRMWQGTQAQYDAIATKDSHILYVVNG